MFPLLAAEEIARRVCAGWSTTEQEVRSALARIHEREESVQAWVWIDEFGGRKAATSTRGLLCGVPFGVKDLIDVAGAATRLGLSDLEYNPTIAQANATAVERLVAHSAVPIGKTTMTALALSRPAGTRHPLDLSRSPGGSSSGSAAAVAAGMVPLALGSQAIGSIIRPASYCGVWAFVPSGGAVPADGSLVFSPTLDRIGIFATTLQGLVLGSRAILGPTAGGACHDHEPRVRVGILADGRIASLATEPGHLLRELQSAAPSLFTTTKLDIDFEQVLQAARSIMAYELHGGRWRRLLRGALDEALITSLAPGAPSEQSYRAAVSFRESLGVLWDGIAGEFDAILLPSATAQAPPGLHDNQDPAPAALGSLLGLPTLNIPLFKSREGLPIGCQLIAPKGSDFLALHIARQISEAVLGPRPGSSM